MTIAHTINCPSCSARLKLTPEFFGRKVRCRKCNHSFRVPDPNAKVDPTGGEVLRSASASGTATPLANSQSDPAALTAANDESPYEAYNKQLLREQASGFPASDGFGGPVVSAPAYSSAYAADALGHLDEENDLNWGLIGWGATLVLFAVLSTVLPLFGLQWRRLANAGELAPIIGTILGLIGAVLIGAGCYRRISLAMAAGGLSACLVLMVCIGVPVGSWMASADDRARRAERSVATGHFENRRSIDRPTTPDRQPAEMPARSPDTSTPGSTRQPTGPNVNPPIIPPRHSPNSPNSRDASSESKRSPDTRDNQAKVNRISSNPTHSGSSGSGSSGSGSSGSGSSGSGSSGTGSSGQSDTNPFDTNPFDPGPIEFNPFATGDEREVEEQMREMAEQFDRRHGEMLNHFGSLPQPSGPQRDIDAQINLARRHHDMIRQISRLELALRGQGLSTLNFPAGMRSPYVGDEGPGVRIMMHVERRPVIGIDYVYDHQKQSFRSIIPVFQSQDHMQISAETGYALSGISVFERNGSITGFKPLFLKIVDNRFDVDDGYEGEWNGETPEDESWAKVIDGEGRAVYGFRARMTSSLVGLGLIWEERQRR